MSLLTAVYGQPGHTSSRSVSSVNGQPVEEYAISCVCVEDDTCDDGFMEERTYLLPLELMRDFMCMGGDRDNNSSILTRSFGD